MLQKLLTYVILWLSIQLLADCQLVPKQRESHTATYIDNKLYILGGNLPDNFTFHLNDFFYLDVSGPFNTKSLSWQDLSRNTTIPPHYGATTVVGGVNNNTLFLYGGYSYDVTMALVYAFDPINKTWSIPNVPDEIFRRRNLIGINSNGKCIYGVDFWQMELLQTICLFLIR